MDGKAKSILVRLIENGHTRDAIMEALTSELISKKHNKTLSKIELKLSSIDAKIKKTLSAIFVLVDSLAEEIGETRKELHRITKNQQVLIAKMNSQNESTKLFLEAIEEVQKSIHYLEEIDAKSSSITHERDEFESDDESWRSWTQRTINHFIMINHGKVDHLDRKRLSRVTGAIDLNSAIHFLDESISFFDEYDVKLKLLKRLYKKLKNESRS